MYQLVNDIYSDDSRGIYGPLRKHMFSLDRFCQFYFGLRARVKSAGFLHEEEIFKEIFQELLDSRVINYIDASIEDCMACLIGWQQDENFLQSLSLHRLVAKHARAACRQACDLLESIGSIHFDGAHLALDLKN